MKKFIINNPKINVIFLYLAIILINLSSCGKDKETSCNSENSVLLPKDAVERFFFRDSSYWIYRDSLSGALDSIWVCQSDLQILNMEKVHPSSKGKCYQAAVIYYQSIWLTPYIIDIMPRTSKIGTEYKDEFFDINIHQGVYFADFGLLKGNNYINFDQKLGIIDSIPSLEVNGVSYNNILRKNNENASQIDLYFISYHVKNIGMVKFIRNDKSVWELIRYKIKQ